MTHQNDLTLAQAVIDDGFEAHQDVLIDLLDRAVRFDVPGILLAVVSDRAAPLVVRHRALGRILAQMAARLPIDDDSPNDPLSHGQPAQTPDEGARATMGWDFDLALHRLLKAWNRHQDLRDTDASIAELFASRTELDDARFAMAQVRPAGTHLQPADTDFGPCEPVSIGAPSHLVAPGQTVVDRHDVEPCHP